MQHVRIARPTCRLAALTAFYRDILGLALLARFEDHDGFDGVMLGRPGAGVHLEFTQQRGAQPPADPSPEHLLVLYFELADWDVAVATVRRAGCPTVASHNPYWDRHGVTIEDPDGYRIVLHCGTWHAP